MLSSNLRFSGGPSSIWSLFQDDKKVLWQPLTAAIPWGDVQRRVTFYSMTITSCFLGCAPLEANKGLTCFFLFAVLSLCSWSSGYWTFEVVFCVWAWGWERCSSHWPGQLHGPVPSEDKHHPWLPGGCEWQSSLLAKRSEFALSNLFGQSSLGVCMEPTIDL